MAPRLRPHKATASPYLPDPTLWSDFWKFQYFLSALGHILCFLSCYSFFKIILSFFGGGVREGGHRKGEVVEDKYPSSHLLQESPDYRLSDRKCTVDP